MSWSRLLQCGYWVQGDALEVAPGSAASGALQSALDDASRYQALTGRRRPVRLLPEQYLLDRKVTLPSYTLLELANGCSIGASASWVPAAGLADSESNALFEAQSVISAATETTLTAAVFEGQNSITTAAGLTAGAWYALVSTNAQTGYPGMSFGADVVRAEPFQVTSVLGLTATLDRELAQTRGAGSAIRRITSLVRDVSILGGGDFALEGRTFACGLFALGVVGLEVEISGAGFSRAMVDLRWCRAIEAAIKNRGQNCSPFFSDSSHEGRVSFDWDRGTTLGHAAALGRARGVAFHNQSSRWLVEGEVGRCVGLEFKGLSSSRLRADLRECDLAARSAGATADPTLFGPVLGGAMMGGCLMNCSNPASSESEVPVGLTVATTLRDCTVPDPSDNNTQFAYLFVDSVATVIERLHVENTGKNPSTAGSRLYGGAFYDTSTFERVRVLDYATRGVQYALTLYGGGNDLVIDEWDYAAQAGSGAGTIAIAFGHQAPGSSAVSVGKMTMSDPPAHLIAEHPGTPAANIDRDTLREVRIGEALDLSTGRRFRDVRFCLDVAGLADFGGIQGDVVEFRPPMAVVVSAAADTLTFAGHDLPDGTPGFLRAGTMPAGAPAAGTVVYVRDSNRSGANTTWKLALTLGGAAIDFTTAGVAVEFQTSYLSVYVPTTVSNVDKGTRLNGVNFGAGLALPIRHYAVACGEEGVARLPAVASLAADRMRATVGALTATIDAAAATPVGISEGKPTTTAGVARYRRVA